jgi:hypothetical protein
MTAHSSLPITQHSFVPAARFCARVLLFASRTRNEGWRSAEIAFRCLRSTGGACLAARPGRGEAPASLGRRTPLGAPPWRFWARAPRFSHRGLPKACASADARSDTASSSRPGRSARKAGCPTSRGDGCEPAPRDATPRSIFRIASGDAPHERGWRGCRVDALCSQAQNERNNYFNANAENNVSSMS